MRSSKSFYTEKRLAIILAFFQYFYLTSAILLLIAFIVESITGKLRIEIFIPIILTSVIAFGIYNRRSWLILLISIIAAWGIISNILSPANMLTSSISLLILVFEIYFFNKKTVKALFGIKGKAFI
jgi:hypothetical protein